MAGKRFREQSKDEVLPCRLRSATSFRNRHLPALGGLFKQVLRLCPTMGPASLGHAALDGTRVQENASKRKAMSCGRMVEAEDLEHSGGLLLEDSVTKKQCRERLRDNITALEAAAATSCCVSVPGCQ